MVHEQLEEIMKDKKGEDVMMQEQKAEKMESGPGALKTPPPITLKLVTSKQSQGYTK